MVHLEAVKWAQNRDGWQLSDDIRLTTFSIRQYPSTWSNTSQRAVETKRVIANIKLHNRARKLHNGSHTSSS